MIRVQLAGAASFAALLAAYAPPRPERSAGAVAEGVEEARPLPHRAGRAEDEAGRARAVPWAVR